MRTDVAGGTVATTTEETDVSEHPEKTGSAAYRCGLCGQDPRWQLTREGDVIVTWACEDHLVLVLTDLLPTDKHRDAARIVDLANTWQPEVTG